MYVLSRDGYSAVGWPSTITESSKRSRWAAKSPKAGKRRATAAARVVFLDTLVFLRFPGTPQRIPGSRRCRLSAARKMAEEPTERHILALDGGGVRGVVTLHLIASLEAHLGKPACEFFDMFAGTSTGAIIAALLAFRRMSAEEVLELYRRLIPRVFRPGWRKLFRPFVQRIYSTDLALEILEEFFGDQRLADLGALRPGNPQAILLTTHDLVRNEEIFLSNYPFQTGAVNYGPTWTVRDAVAASAFSAPWYFGPYQGRFIDGGISIFNTPARQAAIEALDFCASPAFDPGRTVVWSFGS